MNDREKLVLAHVSEIYKEIGMLPESIQMDWMKQPLVMSGSRMGVHGLEVTYNTGYYSKHYMVCFKTKHYNIVDGKVVACEPRPYHLYTMNIVPMEY